MDDLEGLAAWRGHIESRVSTLESTVEAELIARTGMDEDMGELTVKLTAQRDILQALGKVQSEHTATLRDHTSMLRDHTERLVRLEADVVETKVGVQTIIGLLTSAEETDD